MTLVVGAVNRLMLVLHAAMQSGQVDIRLGMARWRDLKERGLDLVRSSRRKVQQSIDLGFPTAAGLRLDAISLNDDPFHAVTLQFSTCAGCWHALQGSSAAFRASSGRAKGSSPCPLSTSR